MIDNHSDSIKERFRIIKHQLKIITNNVNKLNFIHIYQIWKDFFIYIITKNNFSRKKKFFFQHINYIKKLV